MIGKEEVLNLLSRGGFTSILTNLQRTTEFGIVFAIVRAVFVNALLGYGFGKGVRKHTLFNQRYSGIANSTESEY
jgi:hypothetical protein